MSDRTIHAKCPYCGESLEYHDDLGYRRARMVHLIDHSIEAALRVPHGALQKHDRLWDTVENATCDGDTWEAAAFWVHDEVFDFLLDYVGILLNDDEYDQAVAKAVAWFKSNYPSAFDNASEGN